jgi:hypothetical protein
VLGPKLPVGPIARHTNKRSFDYACTCTRWQVVENDGTGAAALTDMGQGDNFVAQNMALGDRDERGGAAAEFGVAPEGDTGLDGIGPFNRRGQIRSLRHSMELTPRHPALPLPRPTL